MLQAETLTEGATPRQQERGKAGKKGKKMQHGDIVKPHKQTVSTEHTGYVEPRRLGEIL